MSTNIVLTPNRIRILEILRNEGGEIHDKDGQATSYLMTQTGHRTTNALSGMLMHMEQDGLIARETGGRRTYSIRLTRQGEKILGAHSPGSAPATRTFEAPEQIVAEPVSSSSEPQLVLNGAVDLDLLAGVLLKKALVATQAQEQSAASKGLESQVKAAEARVAELEQQVRALEDERSELRALVKTLEHNNEVLSAQMDKVRKNPGTPIKELISRTELRELEKLMRSLPAARG